MKATKQSEKSGKLKKSRKGFTLIELLIGIVCFTIVSYVLLQAADTVWFRKFASDDSADSYETVRTGVDVLDGPLSNIGVGMVMNRLKVNDDGTITKKPFDEFRASWLGGSWSASPPPARMLPNAFRTGSAGDVGDGPVTIIKGTNNSDELWFAFGVPTGVYIKSVSRNRKLPGIGDERVPLSSAYMDHNSIKDPSNSSYGDSRFAKYMYLKGYWNDGSDSVVLELSDIHAMRGRYGLEPGAGSVNSGGPDEFYMKDVVEKFSFIENRMSVLQAPHPILSGSKLASLNSWILLSNFRIPLAVEGIFGNKITAKPAPGAYHYKQIMNGVAPVWDYNKATGTLLGGYLGVGDRVFMPRMSRVFLKKNPGRDTVGGDLMFEVCARVTGGSNPVCDSTEHGYSIEKIASGIAGVLWHYDSRLGRLNMTVAVAGKESGMTTAIATGVPPDWPTDRGGMFSNEELQRRILVRTRSWNLPNL